MNQEIAKTIADTATAVAVTAGASSYFKVFEFLNQYAGGIGVLISLLSFTVATTFYVLTYRKPDASIDNTVEIKKLKEQLKNISRREEDK
ncbi:MAG: hypothetical protein MJK15_00705 [Colwellia sp.]|nr:hypothetical protein [Colwellia sp.]